MAYLPYKPVRNARIVRKPFNCVDSCEYPAPMFVAKHRHPLETYLPRLTDRGFLTSTPKRKMALFSPKLTLPPIYRQRKQWVLPVKPVTPDLPNWARMRTPELPKWAMMRPKTPITPITIVSPRHIFYPSISSRSRYKSIRRALPEPRQLFFESDSDSESDDMDYYRTSSSSSTSDEPSDVDVERSLMYE